MMAREGITTNKHVTNTPTRDSLMLSLASNVPWRSLFGQLQAEFASPNATREIVPVRLLATGTAEKLLP